MQLHESNRDRARWKDPSRESQPVRGRGRFNQSHISEALLSGPCHVQLLASSERYIPTG